MKNTHTKEFREKVFTYLCESVYDFEGDRASCARHIFDRFKTEYDYLDNRRRIPNNQARVAEWLSGIALNIAVYNCDIIAKAEEWHDCKLTDAQAETVVDRWFSFMAFKLMQLWQSEGLEL